MSYVNTIENSCGQNTCSELNKYTFLFQGQRSNTGSTIKNNNNKPLWFLAFPPPPPQFAHKTLTRLRRYFVKRSQGKRSSRVSLYSLWSCSTLNEARITSSAAGSILNVNGGPLLLERSSSSVANTSTTFLAGTCSGNTGR